MLGISTYAYTWRRHPDVQGRFSLEDILHDAKELGLGLVQLCDVEELEQPNRSDILALRRTADHLGLVLETGTKGIEPEHLARHLEIAHLLGARLVRSMLAGPRWRPEVREAVRMLRRTMPAFEGQGTMLALETYEQYSTEDLVRVVQEVGSPNLGICLDPGNSVAALERPLDVVAAAAPHVLSVHVKDFAFSRAGGGIGFRLAGAKLGEGLLDYEHMMRCLSGVGAQANQVVEHWMPRTGSLDATARAESAWVQHSVEWMLARHEQTEDKI